MLDFFKKKQEEFWKKYGKDDNAANELIGKELGLNEKVIELLEHKGIDRCPKSEWENNFPLMIFAYADYRVAPCGVVSLKERIDEYAKRNAFHLDKKKMEFSKKFEKFSIELEKELFSHIKIKPSDINDESTKEFVGKY